MTGVGVTSDEGLEPVFEVGWQGLGVLVTAITWEGTLEGSTMTPPERWQWRVSLVGQWLRLYALSAGGLGSIPSQGARSHIQLCAQAR